MSDGEHVKCPLCGGKHLGLLCPDAKPDAAVPVKETILRALESYRGDNLQRARWAFKGLSPDEMAQQYGQSGQTRAELLAGYEAHDQTVSDAVAWVKAQP